MLVRVATWSGFWLDEKENHYWQHLSLGGLYSFTIILVE